MHTRGREDLDELGEFLRNNDDGTHDQHHDHHATQRTLRHNVAVADRGQRDHDEIQRIEQIVHLIGPVSSIFSRTRHTHLSISCGDAVLGDEDEAHGHKQVREDGRQEEHDLTVAICGRGHSVTPVKHVRAEQLTFQQLPAVALQEAQRAIELQDAQWQEEPN